MLILVTAPVALAAVRRPALDTMARAIMERGSIPRGPELMLLAAAAGWNGDIAGVRMGDYDLPAPTGDVSYGSCRVGGSTVVVTGSPSRAGISGIAVAGPVRGRERLTLVGLQRLDDPLVTILHPDLEVDTLTPDSLGRATAELDVEGVHWLEITSTDEAGPSVVSLLPLVRGLSVRQALDTLGSAGGREVSTAGDVLEEINDLRAGLDLEPLQHDPVLEEMARARAVAVARSGRLRHLVPGGTALPEMMRGTDLAYAENIATGSDYAEAWSMIGISPNHLASCLHPGFGSAGVSSALAADGSGWQLVMVQVFADGVPGDGPP